MLKVLDKLNKKTILNLPINLFALIVLMSIYYLVGSSLTINLPFNSLYLLIVILVLFISLILPDFFKKPIFSFEKITFSAIIIYAAINVLINKDITLLLAILLCFSIRNKKMEDVIKVLMICLSIYLFVSIVYYYCLYFFSNIELPVFNRGSSIRQSFGIGHPNLTFLLFANLIIMYAYSNKLDFKKSILLILISIVLQIIIDSKTSLIMSILAIILFYICGRFAELKIIIRNISKFIFPLLFIFVFIISALYENDIEIINIINKALTGRIMLNNMAINRIGFSLFAQNIDYSLVNAGEYFTIDSLYTYFFCEYGFVWIIIFSILFYLASIKGTYKDSILIVLFSLYAVSEYVGINCIYLFSILSIKNAFSDNKLLKNEKI